MYISFVFNPSGSIKVWWDSLSLNLTTLSSIEGQYLAPVAFTLPLYIADLSILSNITLCVSVFVLAKWQGTWSISNLSLINENGVIFASPSWISIWEKSILSLWILAGVPVLNLLIFNPKSTNLSVKWAAYPNPFGPSLNVFSPIYIVEFR